jgi:DtxR family manganese transport transcriptional regulator
MARKRSNTPAVNEAAGHERVREAHAQEIAEDYVEAIADVIDDRGVCRVVDLTRRFGVSHVTVSRTVGRLVKQGLAKTEPHQPIELTKRGRRLAESCRARHELVYQFLMAIGVEERVAAMDAEGIEHHVSPETLDRFRAVVEGGGTLSR